MFGVIEALRQVGTQSVSQWPEFTKWAVCRTSCIPDCRTKRPVFTFAVGAEALLEEFLCLLGFS